MNAKGFRAKSKDWLPYLVYALLSLGILGALLRPGYILTLDIVFTPKLNVSPQLYGLSQSLSSTVPFWLFFNTASEVVPVWLLQKAILFLIFFLAGLGAHRLFPFRGVGSYFAGLIYAVNPFVYVRFLAGQWTVLVAYALMPFAIKAFLNLLEKGSGKNAIKVAVLCTLVGMLQTHGFFLLFLVFVIIFLVHTIKDRTQPTRIIATCKYAVLSGGVFLLLNLYWLIPVLAAGEGIMQQISSQDLLLFSPRATSRIMFDVASMYGFWRGGYLYTQDIFSFWWLLFIFLLFLVAYGFICKLRDDRHRWIVISFVTVGVVSFVLAVGAATDLTKPLFEWLWVQIPFIRGFRDSHKFVALLCLSYAYLGGLSVNEFANTLKTQRKRLARVALIALVAVSVLTPLGYSFTIFGFYGQLGVTDYPQEWYEVNDYLNEDEADFNVLFLPWHLYMDYDWLPNKDKRLANPAQQFFDKPVIAGDNMEMPGIYSQSTNPISKYVEFLLGNVNDVDNLGELLAPLNVKYVILVHEVDYTSYDFLYHQRDLKVDLERPGLTLFRNEHPIAKIYGIDSVVYVESLDEYIKLSEEQDVMEHLYILGSGPSNGGDGEIQRLNFAEKSPLKYQIEGTFRKYTVFTVPQNVSTEHWEYDGKQPLKNLGFMPAFESKSNGGEIVYTRFYHVYLPSYIISTVAMIVLMAAYFNGGRVAKLFRRDRKVTK